MKTHPILISLLIVLGLRTGVWSQDAEIPWLDLMQGAAEEFKKLESGAATGDAKAFHAAREQMVGIGERFQKLHPESAAELAPLMEVLKGLSAPAASATKARLNACLDTIRRSCVGCHAATVPEDEAATMFPARKALLLGKLKLSDADGKPVADRSGLVVFLDGLKETQPPFIPVIDGRIVQKDKRFHPRVLPILRGTTVHFPNEDRTFHNVFSLSRCCRFDLGIYRAGKSRSQRFDTPGLVRVFCNIHPDMNCNLLVLANPWFAVTDAEGRFAIPEVPKSEGRLRIWGEFGVEGRLPFRGQAKGLLHIDPAVARTKRDLPSHRNKFGQPYKKRY